MKHTLNKTKKIRHYSGDKSRKFWSKINRIKGKEGDLLYSMAVVLQDLEHKVLDHLEGD